MKRILFLLLAGTALAVPKPLAEITWHASGKGGAVAAEDPKAVQAGIEMLEKGGNAADAAVSTMLVASVMDYGMFCIGAECPFMIYDAEKKEVKTLSGLGGAPLDEEAIAWYYQNAIPEGGGIHAVPVPGAVGLFFTALEKYGTLDFTTVVQPTLRILDGGGADWYDELAATLRKLVATEGETAGLSAGRSCEPPGTASTRGTSPINSSLITRRRAGFSANGISRHIKPSSKTRSASITAATGFTNAEPGRRAPTCARR